MDELLRRLVEQNDALIALGQSTLTALQDVVDKLEGIQTQLILNDSSTEVSMIHAEVQAVVAAIEGLER